MSYEEVYWKLLEVDKALDRVGKSLDDINEGMDKAFSTIQGKLNNVEERELTRRSEK
ncbi:hypothetical protein [Metabacillus sp. FJAT-52054]|uniref:Uncharacterized protein n=1 Tax=Metabacillus sediminis TaxID=3117746 RepID=A0ABZ2NHK0_9BACI